MWPFQTKKKVPVDRTFADDFKADLAQLLMYKGLGSDDAAMMSDEMVKCAAKKLKELT